ncbi:hypothetical protein [Planococcus lenghuensis]|uniref:Uncharacterized protein n=1 Tax=Planococcus lenghuensis TaxID=2213202 RepID=A0A1Q2L5M5_9BACL|nr:hypothetical protein [Planococcus lenghuensis]AQQ55222.1 hypothetical protein B0X71_18735 [Planococcus lenghuensis]AQQ55279.1 hypothetical protein B0X71_19050 [Planococcus lenghuensis]
MNTTEGKARVHTKRRLEPEDQIKSASYQEAELKRLIPELDEKEQRAVEGAILEIQQLNKQIYNLKQQERALRAEMQEQAEDLKMEKWRVKDTALFLDSLAEEFVKILKTPVNFESEQQLRIHYFELRNTGKKLAGNCKEKSKTLNFLS